MPGDRRSFTLGVRRASEGEEAYEPVEFELNEPNREPHIVKFEFPGEGAMTLFLTATSDEMTRMDQVKLMLDFVRDCTGETSYAYIRRQIRSRNMEIADLTDMIGDVVEQWTTFPTKQPSDYLPPQQSPGRRSTGRSPGAGSTQLASPPTAS